MPNSKQRAFTKRNSVKYLLVKGTSAVNADGETLCSENTLVPVPRSYKSGSTLLAMAMSESADTDNPQLDRIPTNFKMKEPDLNRIMESLGDTSDSETEDCGNYSELKPRSLNKKRIVYEDESEEGSDISDILGQFDDADFVEEDIDSDEGDSNKNKCNAARDSNCPEGMRILNAQFEKMMEEYNEINIGALDDEEICGALSTGNEHLMNMISSPAAEPTDVEVGGCDEDLKKKILESLETDEVEEIVKIVTKLPLEYDCESILSTYSNQYNHPTVIKEASKIKKIQIPSNPMKKKGLTKSQLKQLDVESESGSDSDCDDVVSTATSFNVRKKGETPEERKERKKLFKEAKRESRILKKQNKLAFKNEKKLQDAAAMNVRNNFGSRIF